MEKDFGLIEIDCAFMPSSILPELTFVSIGRILAKQIKGCVLLIDNIDQADNDWLKLFEQYANGYFGAASGTADEDNPRSMQTARRIDRIPEGLFIIGEQRLTSAQSAPD